MTRDDKLSLYDKIIAERTEFERKGKTMPYTSANGHMFSQINKSEQLGIRFSKEVQNKYLEEWQSEIFRSYGSVMQATSPSRRTSGMILN